MSSGGLSTDELAIKRATDQAVKAAGGQDAASMSTVAGRSQLQRCLSPNHRDSITVRDAVTVDAIGAHVEGHPFILRAFAAQLGYGIHKAPVAQPTAAQWHQQIGALASEAGEIIAKMSAGLADGNLCANDITKSGLSADAHQLQEIAACLASWFDAAEAG